MKVGLLKINVDIATVAKTKQKLLQKYPDAFSWIAKSKTKQITLHIDPAVKPVAQPLKRCPLQSVR